MNAAEIIVDVRISVSVLVWTNGTDYPVAARDLPL